MKKREKYKIIADIALYFQANYTFNNIDGIFRDFGLKDVIDNVQYGNSKRVYSEEVLSYTSEDTLLAIVNDFEIPIENIMSKAPKN